MSRNRQPERYAGFHIFYNESAQAWVASQQGYIRWEYTRQSKHDVREAIRETL